MKCQQNLATVNAPRALLTLGTIEECRGNFAEAIRYHLEAMRAGRNADMLSFTCAAAQFATIQAIEGDHAGSLHAFQSIAPFVRAVAKAHPHVYASWHNSLAVELAELGRTNEARAAVAVALASPIADRYPEFAATAAELRQVEPARVAIAVVTPQQEEAETTEAAPPLAIVSSEPRRHRFTLQPNAHTLLNPRASPRAPPSLF